MLPVSASSSPSASCLHIFLALKILKILKILSPNGGLRSLNGESGNSLAREKSGSGFERTLPSFQRSAMVRAAQQDEAGAQSASLEWRSWLVAAAGMGRSSSRSSRLRSRAEDPPRWRGLIGTRACSVRVIARPRNRRQQ